jgi:hypothetical protein
MLPQKGAPPPRSTVSSSLPTVSTVPVDAMTAPAALLSTAFFVVVAILFFVS